MEKLINRHNLQQECTNANPSLNAQLHTKTSTVSKFCECLLSGLKGVELTNMYSVYGRIINRHNLKQECTNANPSLNGQLHTKTSTVSKFSECLSSGLKGVELTNMYSVYGRIINRHNLKQESTNANISLNAQLHTKASTLSKFCECL